MILKCSMERTNLQTGEVITKEGSFHSMIKVNLEGTDLDESFTILLERLAGFKMQGSNRVFKNIVSLKLHMVKYEPLCGGSYIPLPKLLGKKGAIINMKNNDQQCCKWCIIRALHPVEKNPSRIDAQLLLL